MFNLSEFINSNFPKTTKKKFSKQLKEQLRPIAEVLAIMDGNAFFGISKDESGDDNWYEQYLPDAYRIYKANGPDGGWIQETSWMKQLKEEQHHENDAVRNAYYNWKLIKALAKLD